MDAISRREVIKKTLLAGGMMMTLPAFFSTLQSCKSGTSGEVYSPSFFDETQYQVLRDFSDTLIPGSDIPGALDVGVPQLMDEFNSKVFTSEKADQEKKELSPLFEFLNESNFSKLSSDKRHALLLDIEKGNAASQEVSSALGKIKYQLAGFYLGTEEIGENYLNYLPVPGEYQACIPLEEVGGKAWAI